MFRRLDKDLRSVISGLPKMLNLKKLISGGTIAMKIGTGTKVTIGIIGIICRSDYRGTDLDATGRN